VLIRCLRCPNQRIESEPHRLGNPSRVSIFKGWYHSVKERPAVDAGRARNPALVIAVKRQARHFGSARLRYAEK